MLLPRLRDAAGRPTFWLGVNYWSRAGGPRMWEDARFEDDLVRAELAQMRRIGLDCCRSFAFLPTFMPAPPTVDAGARGRFRRFLELCDAERMATIPTFLVGHMSGENYDFPGQAGRSPYSDPELLAWQRALISALGSDGAAQPAVLAYLASNEMPHWGGPASVETIRGWLRELRQALRLVDPTRPFSTGDGVMNLSGGQNGFDPAALGDLLDFVGPHTYYGDTDPYRQALNAEYCLRSLSFLGLPLVFEEFGGSSAQMSEEHQRAYYREVIHAALSSGASGALAWCWSDFALPDEAPYSHHAFELGFGITRADGSEKPVCDELRSIRRLLDELAFDRFDPPPVDAAIVVPAYFNTSYPFSWEERQRLRRTLLQAYVLCVKAGLECALVPETADLSGYQLLLAPATQKLLAPTWRRLRERARQGATVYWSYFDGDYGFHFGAWIDDFEATTGCRHRRRFGCFDLPPAEVALQGPDLALKLATSVGHAPYGRSFLPVEALASEGTEVLARDVALRPALTRVRRGRGQIFFCAYPLEHYLAQSSEINARDGSAALYALLAREAGLAPRLTRDDPAVQLRLVRSADRPLLWLLNHAWSTVELKLDSPGGRPIYGPWTEALEAGVRTLELPAKGVVVLELEEDPAASSVTAPPRA